MTTEMITASPAETVAAAARRMAQNRVGAILLVENGELCGLFSERDLLARVVGEGRNPQTTTVSVVATRELTTIGADQPIKAALDLFRQKKYRHLPVVDGGKPVGILSTRDFHEYLVSGLEKYIDEIKYRRELADGGDPYDHIGGSYGR
jgi:CBS domain-containing protein